MLAESCATLGESQVEYAPNTFHIAVCALSPGDRGCLQTTTHFATTIPLNIKDLPAGNYTVIANGVNAVFTLPVETAWNTFRIEIPASTCVENNNKLEEYQYWQKVSGLKEKLALLERVPEPALNRAARSLLDIT